MKDTAITELLAKQEITERLNDYCRAMDRMDDDLGRTVFHPEAPVDYKDIFQGTGYGFVEWVHQSHAAMIATNHKISNVSIRIDDDRAGSETYVTMHGRIKGEGDAVLEIHSIGRYLDRWEKRDGAWRIAQRQYLSTLDEVRQVGTTAYPVHGARDRSDPSYDLLGAAAPTAA